MPETIERHRAEEGSARRDRALNLESHRVLQEMISGLVMLAGGLAGSLVVSITTLGSGYFVVAGGAIVGGAVLLYQGLVGWSRLPKPKAPR